MVEKTKMLLKIFSIIVLVGGTVNSYNILAVFPHSGLSHHYVFDPLLKELVKKGHDVTAVSHFPTSNPPEGFTDISLAGSFRICTDMIDFGGIRDLIPGEYYHLLEVHNIMGLGAAVCESFLRWPAVQDLLNSSNAYDLIITEQFNSDCSAPLVQKFKAPNVALSSHILMPWSSDRMGTPDNPSYIPSYYSPFNNHMGLIDRALNTGFLYYHKLVYWFQKEQETGIIKAYWDKFNSIDEISSDTNLILVYTHNSLHGSVPRSPNVIDVGGMHIKPAKSLPQVKYYPYYFNFSNFIEILKSLNAPSTVKTQLFYITWQIIILFIILNI